MLIGMATLADLMAIPEEHRRHELIDGRLLEQESSTAAHGAAVIRMCQLLGPYDRASGGWWFAVFVETRFSDTQVFRPDVLGWRRERMVEMPTEVPTRVRPDWICEVLSTNRRNDLIKKKREYHHHEVGHYWLVDPIDETLAVYRWHTDGYVEVLIAEREERVRPEPFDAIDFKVATLFGDDEDE